MAVIWCMAPEIWSMTDMIFCHFGPFFAFLPSPSPPPPPLPSPPNNPKNQHFEKKKKNLVILSFYTCAPQMTIIWCTVSEIRSMTDMIFCHFGPFFAFLPSPSPPPPPLPSPPNNPKNQHFEKKKKNLVILSFYTCAPQMTIIWCTVSEIRSMTDKIFCHFGLFFAILPP